MGITLFVKIGQAKNTSATDVSRIVGCPHYAPVERLSEADRIRLGRNIVKLRNRMIFTQEELASRSAVTPRYLQKIEYGEYGGSLAVLKRIKRGLKADWNSLLEGL